MEYTNTVLIVDDSPIVTQVLSFMIRKAGYNIISAVDGEKALELLDGRDIDLVITDLNMPILDGLELIKEIRLHKYYRYMPVVLFFKDSIEEENKIMKTSGATMLFDKNDIRDKIIPAIKKMIG